MMRVSEWNVNGFCWKSARVAVSALVMYAYGCGDADSQPSTPAAADTAGSPFVGAAAGQAQSAAPAPASARPPAPAQASAGESMAPVAAPAPPKPDPDMFGLIPNSKLPEASPFAARGAVLAEELPRLTEGALSYARLAELPDGLLARTADGGITAAQIATLLEQVPEPKRSQMAKASFPIVEQIISNALIEADAKAAVPAPLKLEGEELVRKYIDGIVSEVEVGDEEIAAFYTENRAMMGGQSLEQIKPQLEMHLLNEKRQKAVMERVRTVGQRVKVEVNEQWAREQDAAASDNPVDKARASGKPTFASFGADSCMPCQMMIPTRESLQKNHGDKINVVYVRVDQDQPTAGRYGVQAIPHLYFFDQNGEKFYDVTGVMSEEDILAKFREIGAL